MPELGTLVAWQTFPKSARPPASVRKLINVFQAHDHELGSDEHTLQSNEVLNIVAPALREEGYLVELSKAVEGKISVPVLYGLNGKIEKSFNADAFHEADGVVLEVEAGRALDNNQILKDLFQACMMQDARHLVICVRNVYRGNRDFDKAQVWFDTLYASQRLRLPLETVTLVGY
jgi:hypothetical protein